jgi:DNA helicase-2/ATP-dependent DNA helicase PcrA
MRRVWGGTFHATANRLLRIYAKPSGLPAEFTILDQSDAADLMNVVRHELGLSATGKRFPRKKTCLAIYSRRVNGGEDLDVVLNRYFPWCAKWQEELTGLFKEYVERKQKQHVLDYDDLLLYWYYLLEDEEMAKSIGGRFDHILVDEYQDTNVIQAGILKRMRLENDNLMVVGDDAQSIYSFRSATVRNMLDFPETFPGTTVVKLEQNYRSTPPILDTTNLLIAQAQDRYTKDLWSARDGGQKPELITCRDEAHQDEAIIERILAHYEEGIPLREQAVLFRAASHSNSLELALSRKNIPFVKYGGLRFLEAAHVKDLINYLRLLENPADQLAWFRILQLIEGVGPKTAQRVFEHVGESDWNPTALKEFKAPAAARTNLQGLGELFSDLQGGMNPATEIERILEYYRPILKRVYENPDARENDIDHLAQMAERFKQRSAFLAELILDPPVSTGDLAAPAPPRRSRRSCASPTWP